MDVLLIQCPRCDQWSRAEVNADAEPNRAARCPKCGGEVELPILDPTPETTGTPRRRWRRAASAILLAPLVGFLVAAACGDWRGVWKGVQARAEAERRALARFEGTFAEGRAAEASGDLLKAIAAYRQAAAPESPGTSRRRQADEARLAAEKRRAEAHQERLRAAEQARAARDYDAAAAALAATIAAFEPSAPEAVASGRALEEVRREAEKLPRYRDLLASGDDLIRAKRYEPAILAFAEAAKLFPEDDAPAAAIRRAEAEREILAAQLDDRAGAAEAAGDLARSTEFLARIVDDVGGSRREEAKRRLADARRALAGNLVRSAREAADRGHFEAAARDFQQAIAAGADAPDVLESKRDADREIALKKCGSLLDAGRYPEALEAATVADQSELKDARTRAIAADARLAVECAEIHRIRTGADPIAALAFRGGDGRLAVATAAGVLQLWDVAAGRYDAPAWERRPAGLPIEALALSTDGRWAALANRTTIEVVDLDAPDAPPRVASLPSPVSALAVAGVGNDGPRLAAGDRLGSAWVWPVAARDADPVPLPTPSSHAVERIAVSRRGDVVVGRRSGPIDLYRAQGSVFHRRPLSDRNSSFHLRPVVCLSLSPDGETLIAWRDSGAISSWSLAADGRTLADRPLDRGAVATAFSPDGSLLAASDGRSLLLGLHRKSGDLPISRPRLIPGLHSDSLLALAFNGVASLATAGADGTVKLWSLDRGKLAAALGKPAD